MTKETVSKATADRLRKQITKYDEILGNRLADINTLKAELADEKAQTEELNNIYDAQQKAFKELEEQHKYATDRADSLQEAVDRQQRTIVELQKRHEMLLQANISQAMALKKLVQDTAT